MRSRSSISSMRPIVSPRQTSGNMSSERSPRPARNSRSWGSWLSFETCTCTGSCVSRTARVAGYSSRRYSSPPVSVISFVPLIRSTSITTASRSRSHRESSAAVAEVSSAARAVNASRTSVRSRLEESRCERSRSVWRRSAGAISTEISDLARSAVSLELVRARKRPNAAGRDKVGDVHEFDFAAVQRRLAAETGGYEIVHESPGLEVGVYVLVAPEPDRQQPHEHDEIYVVLEGRGTLMVEGEAAELDEGGSAYVKAGADHRFTGYEALSVLVLFERD